MTETRILPSRTISQSSPRPNEIDRQVQALKNAVDTLQRDVEQHNKTAPGTVKAELERKRQQAQAASGAVSAIGIPIKRKDQPATYVAPVTRRALPIHRPVPSKDGFKPEPELSEARVSAHSLRHSEPFACHRAKSIVVCDPR